MHLPAIVVFVVILLSEAKVLSSQDSRSAFGEFSSDHTRANALGLVKRTEYAVSIVGCNLKCLSDEDCGGTNFFSSSARDKVACQLLRHHDENEVVLEPEENSIYTRILRQNGKGHVGNGKECDENYFFHSTSGSCFSISKDATGWVAAKDKCLDKGAVLAKINSESKIKFIRSKTRLYFLYVGLLQRKGGLLEWADGEQAVSRKFLERNVVRKFCNKTDHCCGILENPMHQSKMTLGHYSRYCRISSYYVCEKGARRQKIRP